MTKNRARIRATKDLAKTEGIRHPEASYLADHRKLKLPDGTIHDFATGPLRYYGGKGSGMTRAAYNVLKEAERKGWKHTNLLGKYFLDPERVLEHLRSAPFLVFLEEHASGGPDPITEEFLDALANGEYPDLNVLVTAEDLDDNPGRGRNIRCAREELPVWRQIAGFDRIVLAKARIAFALRFADVLAAGADAASALKAVAGELAAFDTPEATCLANAARSGIEPLRSGWKLSEVISRGALRDAVGEHVAEVVKVASDSGKTTAGLRAAAATLEADLRIGLIA